MTKTPKRRRRASPGDPTSAIAYLRCSTDRQELSPESQRELIGKWARAEGVVVRAEHVDIISGKSELDARPGLAAALVDLRARGAGILVVAKRDRLARHVGVAALIERDVAAAGARIAAADGQGNGDDPQSEFMRNLADMFAAHERALIAERTRNALRVKQIRGERTGSVRYGFRLASDGVHLVPDAREQQVIAVVGELRREGATYSAIAEHLDEIGLASRTGSPWDAQRVRRIILRQADPCAR